MSPSLILSELFAPNRPLTPSPPPNPTSASPPTHRHLLLLSACCSPHVAALTRTLKRSCLRDVNEPQLHLGSCALWWFWFLYSYSRLLMWTPKHSPPSVPPAVWQCVLSAKWMAELRKLLLQQISLVPLKLRKAVKPGRCPLHQHLVNRHRRGPSTWVSVRTLQEPLKTLSSRNLTSPRKTP